MSLRLRPVGCGDFGMVWAVLWVFVGVCGLVGGGVLGCLMWMILCGLRRLFLP